MTTRIRMIVGQTFTQPAREFTQTLKSKAKATIQNRYAGHRLLEGDWAVFSLLGHPGWHTAIYRHQFGDARIAVICYRAEPTNSVEIAEVADIIFFGVPSKDLEVEEYDN